MPHLIEDTEYIGTPSVELWVTSDVPAPQLFVRLNVVDSTGRSTNITDTLATVRADPVTPTLVTATLPPTCVRVVRRRATPARCRRRGLPSIRQEPGHRRIPGDGDHVPCRPHRHPPRRRSPEQGRAPAHPGPNVECVIVERVINVRSGTADCSRVRAAGGERGLGRTSRWQRRREPARPDPS